MATGRLPDPNTAPLTAKGDLYTYSTVPAKLAVGSNGDTLVADSSATTGLRWQGDFAAGKNKIINGAFDIWQRGTSLSYTTGTTPYTADRFSFYGDGTSVTRTISQQTFTPGTAPVAGYEGQYYLRFNQSTAGTGNNENSLIHPIEDVRTLAGQTATISFWAKADTTRTVGVTPIQRFGSGGSSQVVITNQNVSVTTSWTRHSLTFSIPSVSGKTIGSGSGLWIYFVLPTGVSQTIEFWGVQLEAGSVATAFQTATGTLAGELAACQRYYQTYSRIGNAALGACWATDAAYAVANFFCQMRVAPTITFAATGTGSNQIRFLTSNGGNPGTVGTIAAQDITTDGFRIAGTGFTSAFTIGNCSVLFAGGTTATTIYTASAEL